MRLDRIGRQGNTFVVKTHRRPSPRLRRLLATGRFKATYIYRDLRDVIVAALEAGERFRATHKPRRLFLIGPYRFAFARLFTVEGAIRYARWRLVPRWEAWVRCPGVLITRYEDLLADTRGELRRLADFLQLDVTDEQMQDIAIKYQRDQGDQAAKVASALNKGVAGRHLEVLSREQQELCRKRLGRYLKRMKYLD